MKALKALNNVERAKLLAQLFPHHLPTMVKAISNYTKSVLKDRQAFTAQWQNSLISAPYWIKICEMIQDTTQQEKGLETKPNVFSDQLFDGMTSLVSASALLLLLKKDDLQDAKFKEAITLFFGA